ncbi:ATP-binding protein [Kitasatospora sp. NPDC085895]|uniref:ATP-binding protein n=1 Tax=Kitasatospora sp. NPDC085895 TaxID=3155057 RepID=UPI00344B0123
MPPPTTESTRHRRFDFRPGDGTVLGLDFLRQALADWRLSASPVAVDALLVAGELLANAADHTPGPQHLDLQWNGECLWIAVTDPVPNPPRPLPYRPETAHGHGLVIVERLSALWGHRPHRPGKTVWAELPAPAPRSR